MDKHPENIIDLASLAEHARMELIDFHGFLSAKYAASMANDRTVDGSGKGRFAKFIASPIRLNTFVAYRGEELHER